MEARTCCVASCHNSAEKDPEFKYYHFPTLSKHDHDETMKQRMSWITAVRSTMPEGSPPWNPHESTVICSAHFVGGEMSEEANSASYIPTLFSAVRKRKSYPTSTCKQQKVCRQISIKQNYPQDADECVEVLNLDNEAAANDFQNQMSEQCSAVIIVDSNDSNKELSKIIVPNDGLGKGMDPRDELSKVIVPHNKLGSNEIEPSSELRHIMALLNNSKAEQLEECMDVREEESKELEEELTDGTYETIFVIEIPSETNEEQDVEDKIASVSNLSQSYVQDQPANEKICALFPEMYKIRKKQKYAACFKCKRSFNSIQDLASHHCVSCLLTKQCRYCDATFDTVNGLQIHISLKHHETKKYVPSNSSTVRSSNLDSTIEKFFHHICMYHIKFDEVENKTIQYSLLTEFVAKNEISTCLECNTTCRNEKQFHEHFETEHSCSEMKNDMIRCKLCQKFHVDLRKMELHMKEKHIEFWNHRVGEKSNYSCVSCEEMFNNHVKVEETSINLKYIKLTRLDSNKFTYKRQLQSPVAYDILSNNYVCTICEPTPSYFNTELKLNSHLQSHNEKHLFKTCISCRLVCLNINSFYNHVKACCKYQNDELNFKHHKNVMNTNCMMCYTCMVDFDNNCILKLHQVFFHNLGTLDMELSINKYSCPICKVIFADAKLFYAHCAPYSVLFPESSRYCEECSILFQTPDDFKNHSITKHREETCFKCKICNECRDSSSQLDSHVSKQHNIQLIHCTKCFANFRVKSHLAVDHFTICNQQHFSCPICGIQFETLKILIDHIKIDMQLLPTKKFQCKYCLNYFFTSYNLCAHVINGKCKACNIYFCDKQKLQDHKEKCPVVNLVET